jgi:hypothetical protein
MGFSGTFILSQRLGDDLYEVAAVHSGKVLELCAAGESVSKDAPVRIG